ncbi:MAG TPA: MBL fold metallo-hydrolase [Pyrinomonadaceae bacterium]|nr:MBL fold metallo-hydrolase [Pyrinomonadaceae bacterium]
MRRITALVVLFALAALPVLPHGDDSHFPNQQDVEFKTTNVSGNVYMLQGRGGNIGAINGPDGILIVDDDYRTMSQKLSDALKALGSAKPRFILNTHWHGDHTEGNEFFGKDSTIFAHVNVRKRMSQVNTIFGREVPASPIHAWPIITYTESMGIYVNGEEIKAVHFPSGHTDGDTVVFFTKANVVHLGDDFFVGRFPFVDLDSGGSVQGLIHNIATLITLIKPDAKLIPGHGPLSTIDDLRAYYRMLVDTSNIVQDGMKAGKSLDDLKKAGFPEKFKEAGSGFVKTDQWIETIYKSYSKK